MDAQTVTQVGTDIFALEGVFTLGSLISFFTLTALEVGLGFDNVAFMGLEINKLPKELHRKANTWGMTMAAGLRIVILGITVWILSLLTAELFRIGGTGFSGKDILLFAGGAFLIWHGCKEIYVTVEKPHDPHGTAQAHKASFWTVMRSILIINIVFSADSVLTAVGMAKSFWVMAASIIASVLVMALFSMYIIDFLSRHLSLKLLAISFLLLIGANLCAEAFHMHMNKAFVYGPALYALFLLILNIRAENNRNRHRKLSAHPA